MKRLLSLSTLYPNAALIDYAGRKADLKLSYLLFEKVLHATMASRPMSTGEYANRVTQYEFVREFFTSNTISTLIAVSAIAQAFGLTH